jgi:hypothetical protein
MSFVLVASVKSIKGGLYHRGTLATVATPTARSARKHRNANQIRT